MTGEMPAAAMQRSPECRRCAAAGPRTPPRPGRPSRCARPSRAARGGLPDRHRAIRSPLSRRQEAEGDLDLRGLLGLAKVPAGFQRVRFRARIESPEAPERIRELQGLVQTRCPVLDTLRLPVEVSGEIEHVAPAEPLGMTA